MNMTINKGLDIAAQLLMILAIAGFTVAFVENILRVYLGESKRVKPAAQAAGWMAFFFLVLRLAKWG